MAHQAHRKIDLGRTDPEDGYVVPGPRATDVVGQALRGAFGIGSLPEDMQAALRKLDGLRPA